MDKLSVALQTFSTIKQHGANGEKLAISVLQVRTKIDDIVTTFEAGSVDPEWTEAFIDMAGQLTLEYASAVYAILKETQAKLDALG